MEQDIRKINDLVAQKGRFAALYRCGVREGDRFVVLDGYRVRNWEQYKCVRSFSDRPRMTAIVWRDGRFVRLSGVYRYRFLAPVVNGLQRAPIQERDTAT